MSHMLVPILAKDFTAATPGTGPHAAYSNLVVSTSATGYIEWKVNVPRAGRWYLHWFMAAGDTRPCDLTINGQKQAIPILDGVSGGWYGDNLKWFGRGPFDFKLGENVVRADFPKALSAVKMLALSTDAPLIRVEAKDFTSAGKDTRVASEYSNYLVTFTPAGYVEWKVQLPSAGRWRIHALMTAQSARPCILTINGKKASDTFIDRATGGWNSATLEWCSYGPFDFNAGDNACRIDFTNAMPHLKEFIFSREPEPPPEKVDTPTTKVGPAGTCVSELVMDILPKALNTAPRMKAIMLDAAWNCDWISVEYEDPATKQTEVSGVHPTKGLIGARGTHGGTFEIAADDFLSGMEVSWGSCASGYLYDSIVQLQFETGKGVKSKLFGGGNGVSLATKTSFKAPDGQQIIGFFVGSDKAGVSPRSIGIHCIPLAAPLRGIVDTSAAVAAMLERLNRESLLRLLTELAQALDEQCKALDGKLAGELAKVRTDLQTQIDTLKQAGQEQATRLDEAQKNREALQKKLDELLAGFDAKAGEIAKGILDSRLPDITGQVSSSLDTRVKELLDQSIRQVDVQAIQAKIAELNAATATLTKAADTLSDGEIAEIKQHLATLLLTMDLSGVLQNIRLEVGGTTYRMDELLRILASGDKVKAFHLVYDADDVTGARFVLVDDTEVTFERTRSEDAALSEVEYAFKTSDWKGLGASFALRFKKSTHEIRLYDKPLAFDSYDAIYQSNVVFAWRDPGPEDADSDTDTHVATTGEPDNFQVIDGIGPKISELLHNAGITTYQQLAALSLVRFREILTAGGPRFAIADLSAWPEQSKLAAEGRWDELKAVQAARRAARQP